jgi:hypothetical protein
MLPSTGLARDSMLSGSELWFGFNVAEAADPFAGRQLGYFAFALIAVVGIDRVHDQRRSEAAVDALGLQRHQPVI